MGAGASTLEGVDQIKLQLLQAELNKPKNLSDITEITNVKEEVKKIRVLFNESGLDKVGSEAIKLEAGKPLDCSDINDDGNSELIRLRSLLETLKATSNESSSNFVDAHFPQTMMLARELVAHGPTPKVLTAENQFRARQMCEACTGKPHVCGKTAA